ncbi:MAG: copper amine oxidase-like protein [Symbiobacteriaceae bacterium]|jgi:mono/diheme cytochrome c family protein|nr:copper amine oxidase-like protein [Symbiobacteriaceae bacterium]
MRATRINHRRVLTGAALVLILTLGLLVNAAVARAEEEAVYVTLDGRSLLLDVPGQIREGRTLVPFRAIFEALGADVSWDPMAQTVYAERGDDTLALTIGSRVVEWRGSMIKVDAPPVIVDGRTLVPLRLVAQAMGLHVTWNGEERTVELETSPADRNLARGIQIVHDKGCMVCHTINGAGGQIGPDLTGVGARYSEEWLHTWLENPQAVRTGSRMPNFRFTDTDLTAVVTYLETLQ